jgi:DNA polymerase III subunit alpha
LRRYKLVDRVAALGQKSVAMTDHGNIYGAVHFFDAAKAKGVKPILGCELYVCKAEDHRAPSEGDDNNHLLVLAENEEGYRNLIRITSEASAARVLSQAAREQEVSGGTCEGADRVFRLPERRAVRGAAGGRYEKAAVAQQYQDIFGKGNFFLEIQDQGLEQRRRFMSAVPAGARAGDSAGGDQRLALPVRRRLARARRDAVRADGREDSRQGAVPLRQRPVFCEERGRDGAGVQGFAGACCADDGDCRALQLKLHKVDNPFPEFAVPEGHTIDSYFEEVCREGLKKRLDTAVRQLELRGVRRATPHEYEARLNFEIGIIKQMKYSGYFLIVWDFIKYARDHGIPVGPGRGSATGSLVAYAMEITNIDPLQNVLLFERFLNPERVTMPDIDVDFCMNRRGEVIDYVTRKYGREQVAQIITFNTMAAKAAIKDCGRALDMPYGDVDRIAKLVPATVGMTIDKALEDVPDLRKAYDNDKQIRELIDTAKKLEGLVRGAGVHASAVVIAPRPLTSWCR